MGHDGQLGAATVAIVTITALRAPATLTLRFSWLRCPRTARVHNEYEYCNNLCCSQSALLRKGLRSCPWAAAPDGAIADATQHGITRGAIYKALLTFRLPW
jgi:hypothetical protein